MLPKLFIGSSIAGLELARTIRTHLSGIATVEVWQDSTIFQETEPPLSGLLDAVHDFDFAVVVLTPDDSVEGSSDLRAPRRNVLFEFGLFLGVLGTRRSFPILSNDPEPELPRYLFVNTFFYFSLHQTDFCGVALEISKKLKQKIETFGRRERGHEVREHTVQSLREYSRFQPGHWTLDLYRFSRFARNILPDDAFDRTLNDRFGRLCASVVYSSKFMRLIRDAIDDDNIALYIFAIAKSDVDSEYNLSYCVRTHDEFDPNDNRPNNWTTFTQLACRDTNDDEKRKVEQDTEDDRLKAIHDPRFGHWLIDDSPQVPLAVFLEFSRDQDWSVSFPSTSPGEYPLVYALRASSKSDQRHVVESEFESKRRIQLSKLNKHLCALQEMLADESDSNRMGHEISSAINIPIHGNPSINVQVLSRKRLRFYSDDWSNYMWAGAPDKHEELFISLQQVMALRLAAERFQGLLLYEMYGGAIKRRRPAVGPGNEFIKA
jgi:hypothetical protein